MNKENLNFLNSSKGVELIKHLLSLSDAKRYGYLFNAKEDDRDNVSSALHLISLRKKASEKFSLASAMFFTTLGLEQSSSERVSDHIASRFDSSWEIADLTCGVGGNLLSLAKKCKSVDAIDIDENTLECAKLNAKTYNVFDKINFYLTSAEEYVSNLGNKKIDAIFIDPARDREGKTKTRSILNSKPKLLDILNDLLKITDNIAVKISPAFDYHEIATLPGDPEVEVISEDNNCKVAMLWFGKLKKAKRSATCFRKNGDYYFSSEKLDEKTIQLDFDKQAGIVIKPEKYIIEIDKAISRAGLLDSFAAYYDLKKISLNSSFLSGSNPVNSACKVFEVGAFFESSWRSFKKTLSAHKIEKAEVIGRGHFLKPEDIYGKLKIKEGNENVLIFIPLADKKNMMIICKRV